jgi:hypothetical protein
MGLEINDKLNSYFPFGNFSSHHMYNYLNLQVAGFNHDLYGTWTIDLMTSLDTSKLNETLRKQRSANLNLCVTIYIWSNVELPLVHPATYIPIPTVLGLEFRQSIWWSIDRSTDPLPPQQFRKKS